MSDDSWLVTSQIEAWTNAAALRKLPSHAEVPARGFKFLAKTKRCSRPHYQTPNTQHHLEDCDCSRSSIYRTVSHQSLNFICDNASSNNFFVGSTPSPKHPTESLHLSTMAQNSEVPTFKLVLVGDGGTGKVRIITEM